MYSSSNHSLCKVYRKIEIDVLYYANVWPWERTRIACAQGFHVSILGEQFRALFELRFLPLPIHAEFSFRSLLARSCHYVTTTGYWLVWGSTWRRGHVTHQQNGDEPLEYMNSGHDTHAEVERRHVACFLFLCCFTSTEAGLPIRDGDRVGKGPGWLARPRKPPEKDRRDRGPPP